MHKVGIRRMFLNQIGIWNLEFRFCKESNTGGTVEELSEQARKSSTNSTRM